MICAMTSWSDFKSVCVTKKGLSIQYEDLGLVYHVMGPDANEILWDIHIRKKLDDGSDNPDSLDFEANVKPGANGSILPFTEDGVPRVNNCSGVDPENMCFIQGVHGEPTPANPYVEWQVTYPSIQMSGTQVDVESCELWDGIELEVGYYVDGEWTSVSRYTNGIAFAGTSWHFQVTTDVKTNPIPQGLYLRAKYNFANPQTQNVPKVSIIYYLWRPYA